MAELKKLQLPKEIKSIIIEPIPEALIKEREGGGKKMLSYLSGSTVTDMLNRAFGYMWSWKVDKEWIEQSIPYFNAYSKAAEEDKVFYNGKKGAWEAQGPVAHVRGILTVYMQSDDGSIIELNKTGYGSKSILGKQNDQESIFKSAGTDALKKAASLFGIGLELYRDEEEQEYFNAINYEDPWTDEAKEEYADDLAFISGIMETHNIDAEMMGDYVSEFSEQALNSLGDITPDNIEAFVSFIKAKMKAAGLQVD